MKKFIIASLVLFVSFANAQDKTQEELKAEREVLKAELKSEKYLERQKKLQELKEPAPLSIASIDGLAVSSSTNLKEVQAINQLIPEMYKRTVGETVDGVTDVTVKKPTLDELLALSTRVLSLTKSVATTTSSLVSAQGDVKSAGVMKAGKALKSLDYSKDANVLIGSELAVQGKLIGNLISTWKSSNNQ